MSERLSCELIDNIRKAIYDLQKYGLFSDEDEKVYEGWYECLTWVRHRLYPEGCSEAEKVG